MLIPILAINRRAIHTIACGCIAYALQGVPAIILGARNPSHVPDHQALFTFTLDAADEEAIAGQLAKGKKGKGDCYDYERGGKW